MRNIREPAEQRVKLWHERSDSLDNSDNNSSQDSELDADQKRLDSLPKDQLRAIINKEPLNVPDKYFYRNVF